MRIFDVLSFSRDFLESLIREGIRIEDCRYVDMYREYTRMADAGEKGTYIVSVLTEKYGVSERTFFNVKRRLERKCKDDAAG
jgi:hypothetical protein